MNIAILAAEGGHAANNWFFGDIKEVNGGKIPPLEFLVDALGSHRCVTIRAAVEESDFVHCCR